MVYDDEDDFDRHEVDDFEYLIHEGEKEYSPDSYFLKAKKEIIELYENNRKSVFYMRQLQVRFEKDYYHWITCNAVRSLAKERYLEQINEEIKIGDNSIHLHFFSHKTNRYPKREINAMKKIISDFSQPPITSGCGNRAEILFAEGLASRGFIPVQKKVRAYNGKEWTKSKHDLDYVFVKDGIAYGCEIKNTLPYIDKDELETKLEMCRFFGIRPLFIMRYSPKSYNDMIWKEGGFALIFKAQIYELGQRELVDRIRDNLGYEADCPKAIPEGIIDRFDNWHNKHKNV